MCVRILSTTAVHSTAPNSSDNFCSYPPNHNNSSDDVYWRGGGCALPLLVISLVTAPCVNYRDTYI